MNRLYNSTPKSTTTWQARQLSADGEPELLCEHEGANAEAKARARALSVAVNAKPRSPKVQLVEVTTIERLDVELTPESAAQMLTPARAAPSPSSGDLSDTM